MRKTKHEHPDGSGEAGFRMNVMNHAGRAAESIGLAGRYVADRPEMRENKGDTTC